MAVFKGNFADYYCDVQNFLLLWFFYFQMSEFEEFFDIISSFLITCCRPFSCECKAITGGHVITKSMSISVEYVSDRW